MERLFEKETYGKVALQKMGNPTDPNFRLYEVGWLETGAHPSTWDTMEVKGAVFREATRGPRKGRLCIPVAGTKLTAYVTKTEMAAFEKSEKPKFRVTPNHCNCHPETCGCNPYKIVDQDGNKTATAFTEKEANKLAEIMNK